MLALGLGLAGWQWGGPMAQQAPILFWQRQCMRYTASADEVVYEEDPANVARYLGGRDGAYVAYPLARGASPDTTPVKTVAAAARMPTCWQRFTALVPPKIPQLGAMSGAILFLHERTSPAGHRRLVCVRYYAETYSFTTAFIDAYNCQRAVFAPGTWTLPPAESARVTMIDVISGFPRHPPRVRIYAGQADPDDASHFTIRYQMWGQEDVLDGRLDDNDNVTVTPRKSPADTR